MLGLSTEFRDPEKKFLTCRNEYEDGIQIGGLLISRFWLDNHRKLGSYKYHLNVNKSDEV